MSAEGSRQREDLRVLTIAALVFAFAAGLLIPAFRNGYPLLRFDSGGYIDAAVSLQFFRARPIAYPLALRAAMAFDTLWVAVAAQALVTSVLALRAARVLLPRTRFPLAACGAACGAALVLTALPGYVSCLMPDAFTGWLFLGGALCLRGEWLLDRAGGAAAVLASLTVHSTHLPVALGSLILLLFFASIGPWRARVTRARIAQLGAVVLLSIPAMLALNTVYGARVPLLGHPAFLVARQHSMGILVPTLDRHCGERRWRLCGYRDDLARHPATTAGWFLWNPGSPFRDVGGFTAQAELAEIARAGVLGSLPTVAAATVRGAWTQFWDVRSRGGVTSAAVTRPAEVLSRRPSGQAAGLVASDQAAGRAVALTVVRRLDEGLVHLVLVGLAGIVAAVCWMRGRHEPAAIIVSALLFLCLHAIVVSFGSTPYGRYQARVAWLVPYSLCLALWAVTFRRAETD